MLICGMGKMETATVTFYTCSECSWFDETPEGHMGEDACNPHSQLTEHTV